MMIDEPAMELGDFTVHVVVTSPPWYENCYVVMHNSTGDQVIVDPGGDADRIMAKVRQNMDAAGKGAVKAILLTHGHPDHIGGAAEIQTAFDLPCFAHEDEKPLLSQASGWASAMMNMDLKVPKIEEHFKTGDTYKFGGYDVRVVATPGHTAGGVCFDFGSFVLTGDTLFNEGVGRTDLPGGDAAILSKSITRLLGNVDDKAMLFSGHGPQWSAREARSWWRRAAW